MTYREVLQEIAEDQYGFITTADLALLKIPVVELRKLAARGKLVHVRRGVYKFPKTKPNERDDFAAALVNVGDGSYLVRDAVLALHGLALVNPNKIRVGTARRVRHELPAFVLLEHGAVEESEIDIVEGLRATRVARAIIDCQGLIMNDRLMQALNEATAQGVVTHKEFLHARKVLRAKSGK